MFLRTLARRRFLRGVHTLPYAHCRDRTTLLGTHHLNIESAVDVIETLMHERPHRVLVEISQERHSDMVNSRMAIARLLRYCVVEHSENDVVRDFCETIARWDGKPRGEYLWSQFHQLGPYDESRRVEDTSADIVVRERRVRSQGKKKRGRGRGSRNTARKSVRGGGVSDSKAQRQAVLQEFGHGEDADDSFAARTTRKLAAAAGKQVYKAELLKSNTGLDMLAACLYPHYAEMKVADGADLPVPQLVHTDLPAKRYGVVRTRKDALGLWKALRGGFLGHYFRREWREHKTTLLIMREMDCAAGDAPNLPDEKGTLASSFREELSLWWEHVGKHELELMKEHGDLPELVDLFAARADRCTELIAQAHASDTDGDQRVVAVMGMSNLPVQVQRLDEL